MARLDELSQRLKGRFKDVPNVTIEDTDEWIELSMNEHGFSRGSDVPTQFISLVMMYAEADGAQQVALRTAHYFDYGDRDEKVNKSNVAKQYRELAKHLWERYRLKRISGVDSFGGSTFTVMTRVDRN